MFFLLREDEMPFDNQFDYQEIINYFNCLTLKKTNFLMIMVWPIEAKMGLYCPYPEFFFK